MTLADGDVSLGRDDLLIETGSPEGYQFQSEAGRVVALKTDVDDALRRGGAGARAHPRRPARAQNPPVSVSRTPSARGSTCRTSCARAGRAPPRRDHGRDAGQRVRARSGPRRPPGHGQGRTDARLGIGLAVTGTIFTATYG